MIEFDCITIETVEDMRVAGVRSGGGDHPSSFCESSSSSSSATTTITATCFSHEDAAASSSSSSSSGFSRSDGKASFTDGWQPHQEGSATDASPTDPFVTVLSTAESRTHASSSTTSSSSSSARQGSQTYWNVQQVDAFSRGRMINYIRRMGVTTTNPFHITTSVETLGQPVHVGSRQAASSPPTETQEEEEEEAVISTMLYTATLHLPLPPPHGSYIAEGVGENRKDAELLACMHAERVCDALGVPLFRLPSMQQNYAENVRRQEGRYAPLPGDALKPEGTPVPPPLRMVSAAVEVALQKKKQKKNRASSSPPTVEAVVDPLRETLPFPMTARVEGISLPKTKAPTEEEEGEEKEKRGEGPRTFLSASSSLFSPRVKEAEVVQEHLSSSSSIVSTCHRRRAEKGGDGGGPSPPPPEEKEKGHSVSSTPPVGSASPSPLLSRNVRHQQDEAARKEVVKGKENEVVQKEAVGSASSSIKVEEEAAGRRPPHQAEDWVTDFRSHLYYPWSLSNARRGFLGVVPSSPSNGDSGGGGGSASTTPISLTNTKIGLDPTEGGRWQMTNVVSSRRSLFPDDAVSFPCVLDPLAMERLKDYLLQHAASSSSSSSLSLSKTLEEAFVCTHVTLPGSPTRMYIAELSLSIPSSSSSSLVSGATAGCTPPTTVLAKGKAIQKEVAKLLAAMHAELLLDALGVPLFPNDPARQARHAKAAAVYGRPWVVGGNHEEEEGRVSSSSRAIDPPALPLPLKQQLGNGEEIWSDTPCTGSTSSSSTSPPPLATAAPTTTTSTSSLYRRTEGERIVGAQNELNFLCSDAIEVYPPTALLDEAEAILSRWQTHVVGSPYPACFLLTKMGDFYRAATLTPVPKSFGVRGGIAIARTPSLAVGLCALHAVDSLCLLGIPLFPSPEAQAAFLQRRQEMGRGTAEEWVGWWQRKDPIALEPAVTYEKTLMRMVREGMRWEEEKEEVVVVQTEAEDAHEVGGGPPTSSSSSLTRRRRRSTSMWHWKHVLRTLDNHHHRYQQVQQSQRRGIPAPLSPVGVGAAASSSSSSPGTSVLSGWITPPYLPAYIFEGNRPRRLPLSTDIRDALQISIVHDVEEYGKGCSEEVLIHIGNEVKVCVQNYLKHQYDVREQEKAREREMERKRLAGGGIGGGGGGVATVVIPVVETKKMRKKRRQQELLRAQQEQQEGGAALHTPDETKNEKKKEEKGEESPLPLVHGWEASTPPLLLPSICITGYGRTGASVHNVAFLRLLPPFTPKNKNKSKHTLSQSTLSSVSSSSSTPLRASPGQAGRGEMDKKEATRVSRLVPVKPHDPTRTMGESSCLGSSTPMPTMTTTTTTPMEKVEEDMGTTASSTTAVVPPEVFTTSFLPPLSSASCFDGPSPTTTSSSSSLSYVPLAVGFSLKKKDAERACYLHAARLLYEVYGEDVLLHHRAGLPRLSAVGSFDALREKCFKGMSPPPWSLSSSSPSSSSRHLDGTVQEENKDGDPSHHRPTTVTAPSAEHPSLPPPKPLIHTTMKAFIDTGRYMTVQKSKRSPF